MSVTRREVVLGAAAAAAASDTPKVMTVRGPLDAAKLGLCLPHEHLFSLFGGDPAEPAAYDEPGLLATVLPYIRKVQAAGCGAIADCTAAWFGRRPDLLRRISAETGIHLLTNTGYYGAAKDRYVPKQAFEESAEQIAGRWVAEWRNGIGNTGVRPGFMKLGVDEGPLSAIDRKLLEAAAIAHLKTGLAIAVHTGNNPEAARQQLEVLRAGGVSPEAWVWVHANGCAESRPLVEAAARGAWISLDGLEPANVQRHADHLAVLRRAGHLNRVLLSHDGNSFRYGGRPARPYEALFTHLLPELRRAGYSDEELRQLTVVNPARALSVRLRRT